MSHFEFNRLETLSKIPSFFRFTHRFLCFFVLFGFAHCFIDFWYFFFDSFIFVTKFRHYKFVWRRQIETKQCCGFNLLQFVWKMNILNSVFYLAKARTTPKIGNKKTTTVKFFLFSQNSIIHKEMRTKSFKGQREKIN